MGWISQYYDRRVAAGRARGLLWQVGHTENGQPITDEQFDVMLGGLRDALDLQPDDQLLDLCCGNGVFTRALAGSVGSTLGVDVSPALIEVAQRECQAENLTYIVGDAKRPPARTASGGKFNKILLNSALQHFSFSEFRAMLESLVTQSTADRAMLFAFVPDSERRADFEDRLRPGIGLRLRRLFGRDLVGHWYGREDITRLCGELGLQVEFLPVDPSIDGARYRFNILIR